MASCAIFLQKVIKVICNYSWNEIIAIKRNMVQLFWGKMRLFTSEIIKKNMNPWYVSWCRIIQQENTQKFVECGKNPKQTSENSTCNVNICELPPFRPVLQREITHFLNKMTHSLNFFLLLDPVLIVIKHVSNKIPLFTILAPVYWSIF